MFQSRRKFLKTAAASGTLAAVSATPAVATQGHLKPDQIVARFAELHGDKAFKILAPAAAGNKPFVAQLDSSRTLFFASAIKTFALCEALRQADSPDVVEHLEQRAIALDSTIWSPGSPIFNPPDVTGIVSERTAMEAMILRSDNTATYMIFEFAGVNNIRNFVASAGLTATRVPDSRRALTAYLYGATDYDNVTWEQVLKLIAGPIVQPFLNDVQTD